MNPRDLINAHCGCGTPLAEMLMAHSQKVRDKALAAARRVMHLHPDIDFIAEAAMLHDIGIVNTSAPRLGCHGRLPYVCHGVEGRKILESRGLAAHGLVCERHVGVGISVSDIRTQQLPLPQREMLPLSLEERLICYADKFFSKTNGHQEKPVGAVIAELTPFGDDKVRRFLQWHRQFDPEAE